MLKRTHSEKPTVSPTSIEQGAPSPAIPAIASAGFFQPIETQQKKTVRFANMCKVVLIPTKQEYKKAGIILWSTVDELRSFKDDYINESLIKKTQKLNATISSIPVAQEQEGALEESYMSPSK
jgi:hypothetical protein